MKIQVFQFVAFIVALLTTVSMIHDVMLNMILIYKDQEKRAKPVYIWVPSFCWGIFYGLSIF